jgi:hypothetical protein
MYNLCRLNTWIHKPEADPSVETVGYLDYSSLSAQDNMRSVVVLGLAIFTATSLSYNFEFESIQLRDVDAAHFPAIAYGNASTANSTDDTPECKAFPDSPDWPLDDEWAKLNSSLDGVLLKPTPPGAACYNTSQDYDAVQCAWILANASRTRFYIDDPLTVLTAWAEGNTCPVSNNTSGTCTQGGFPVYVVNATTVKHIQIAVNFARNKNIRLIIKYA